MKIGEVLCIIVSTLGVIFGVTLSYFIGRKFGVKFFNKYGKYIHLGPEKIKKVNKWFDKYGNKLLIFTYFIPGVRHITGYTAGTTNLSYKKFSVNAYLGAFIWVTTFISLGKILGDNWNNINKYIGSYLIFGIFILIVILEISILLNKN
ncbi:DedA family protein [Clostridioides difficile]